MIARPRMSQNEWKSTEIRGFKKLGSSHPFPAQVSPGELALQTQQQKLGDYLRRVRRVGRELVTSRKDAELDRCALLQFARLERAIESGGALGAALDVTKTSLHVIRNGDVAPDQETRTGTTALFVAAHAGDHKLLDNLITAGCDVNYANRNLRTALMAAADADRLECVLCLLRHGADAAARDVNSHQAAVFGVRRQAKPGTELAEVLLEARGHQDRKRVIQRRFNVSVLEAISERKASTL